MILFALPVWVPALGLSLFLLWGRRRAMLREKYGDP